MTNEKSELLQGTLDMLILQGAPARTDARLRAVGPPQADVAGTVQVEMGSL